MSESSFTDGLNGAWGKNLIALNTNNQALAKILTGAENAGCEIKPARKKGLTLTVDGQTVLSRYDPIQEAEDFCNRFLKNKLKLKELLLIGFELGYLAEAIHHKSPECRIIVVEPEKRVLISAMQSRDLSELLQNISVINADSIEQTITSLEEQVGGQESLARYELITSPAIRRYSPAFAHEVANRIKENRIKRKKRLRILVVGPIYGGSLPITFYVRDALTSLGHRVEVLDNSSFAPGLEHLETVATQTDHLTGLKSRFTSLLAQTVVIKAVEMKAQLIFVMAQAPVTSDALQELRRIGIPTAFWFVEDGRMMEYGKKMAPFYDVFFHIQNGAFEKDLKNCGARHIHYLPLAADPNIHCPIQLTPEEREKFGAAISHVGAGYFNRRHFFLGLLDFDFKIWGNDWKDAGILARVLQEGGRRVSTEESVKIFNATRINLNLHSSSYVEGVDPTGDFLNPRTFELAAMGAFQLVDDRSALPEMFIPGRELVTFRDLAECREKIHYYLAHPEEAAVIARASRARALRDHTYKQRMSDALDFILKHCEPAFPETPLNTVEELIAEAEGDDELVAFLQQLGKPDEELTLEGIADKVGRQKGKMSEPAAMFVLMNEFQQWAVEKGLV